MRSIGVDLHRWVDKGLLHFHASRPTAFGLELHLVKIHKLLREFQPSVVVVDPVTALLHSGTPTEARSMLLRLVDFLKGSHITALLMTALTHGGDAQEQTEMPQAAMTRSPPWRCSRDSLFPALFKSHTPQSG
jgi:circadian clock protein KaiC